MSIVRMSDLDLQGKRVLIREDLNVPIDDGRITSEQRITAAIPTMKLALEKGAAVMVTSHLGRPKEGTWTQEDSLAPVAKRLSELLGIDVPLVKDWVDGAVDVKPGQLVLLENCRMNVGEGKDDEALSKKYAALCDVYRHGRLRHRAPRAGVHAWRDPVREGRRRRPAADGRTRRPGQGAGQPGAPAARHRRRLEGRRRSWNCCRRWWARSTS